MQSKVTSEYVIWTNYSKNEKVEKTVDLGFSRIRSTLQDWIMI